LNNIVRSLGGYLDVVITGASPSCVLNKLTASRIPFWQLHWLDEFTLHICLFSKDYACVKRIAEQMQCETKQAERGLPIRLRSLLRRPVLWFWCVFTVAVVTIIPCFLLWYQVEGNDTIPDAVILRTLEALDIGFGTYGPTIKPRWIKDHVLNMLPQLQWITVTQNGCMATVTVRERPETPETIDRRGYANVIASQSGMIMSQSILAGQAVRQPGDFVLEGELLVSGLVDLERVFTMEYAQAEVFARTWRKKTVVMPDSCLLKSTTDKEFAALWLEIGKKRIKIFGNSGISTASCDKMINRKILSLPGGLELPVSLLEETYVEQAPVVSQVDPELAADQMMTYVRCRTNADLRAGSICSEEIQFDQQSGCYRLYAVLTCHEMIAETVEAKWNEKDYQYDGKND